MNNIAQSTSTHDIRGSPDQRISLHDQRISLHDQRITLHDQRFLKTWSRANMPPTLTCDSS
jgi:hypothetical protein